MDVIGHFLLFNSPHHLHRHQFNLFFWKKLPDMFTPTTPIPNTLRVRDDLFPDLDSQSSVSPSMLDLPRPGMLSEYNMLIVGDIINTTRHSGEQSTEMDWSDDGNDAELNRHMDVYDKENVVDNELNYHMDVYEGLRGGLR